MTTLSRHGMRLREVVADRVGRPLRARRRQAMREYERRSQWAEQARRAPTLRQLIESGTAGRAEPRS